MWEGDLYRPLTLNGWSYVENNPLNYIDPTGECSIENPTAAAVSPSPQQARELIPSLDRSWLIGDKDYKPECCQLDPCGEKCIERERRGETLATPTYRNFTNADDYMRYWLAWEKLNPCCYRKDANCMGAALEVSYQYTKFGSFDGYIDAKNGYGDVERWGEFLGEGYFNVQNYLATSTGHGGYSITYLPPSNLQPGDILSYEPQGLLATLGDNLRKSRILPNSYGCSHKSFGRQRKTLF